jgi:hypothetical protein
VPGPAVNALDLFREGCVATIVVAALLHVVFVAILADLISTKNVISYTLACFLKHDHFKECFGPFFATRRVQNGPKISVLIGPDKGGTYDVGSTVSAPERRALIYRCPILAAVTFPFCCGGMSPDGALCLLESVRLSDCCTRCTLSALVITCSFVVCCSLCSWCSSTSLGFEADAHATASRQAVASAGRRIRPTCFLHSLFLVKLVCLRKSSS